MSQTFTVTFDTDQAHDLRERVEATGHSAPQMIAEAIRNAIGILPTVEEINEGEIK